MYLHCAHGVIEYEQIHFLIIKNMATINIRTDEKLKKAAGKVFKTIGLDMSNAVKLFLYQVVITKSIPFPLRTINGFTVEEEKKILKDIKITENQIKAGKRKLFNSAKEMIDDILK